MTRQSSLDPTAVYMSMYTTCLGKSHLQCSVRGVGSMSLRYTQHLQSQYVLAAPISPGMAVKACVLLLARLVLSLVTHGLLVTPVLSCCCACHQVHVVYEGSVTLSHQQLLALMHYQHTVNNTINWSNKVSKATLCLRLPGSMSAMVAAPGLTVVLD